MRKNKKGFSLIEMGVVVAIVALIFLVSLNVVQSMYTAYVTKSAKAALAIGKQEVLNFVAQYQKLPSEAEFDSLIRSNIPLNQDSALAYHPKSTIAPFLLPEQYCGYKYMNSNEETLGVILEETSSALNPFAFSMGYQYKKETPMLEIASYYELLDVLGCADSIRPSFVTTQLPMITDSSTYKATINIKPRAGEGDVQFCIVASPIPGGAAINNKFQTNGIACNAFTCLWPNANDCINSNFGRTDNDSIVISLRPGQTLDNLNGVRFRVFMQDDDRSYTVEKEYTIFQR